MSVLERAVGILLVVELGALVAASLLIIHTTARYRDGWLYPGSTGLLGLAALLVTTGALIQSVVYIGGIGPAVLVTLGSGVITLGMVAFTYATYLLCRDVLQFTGTDQGIEREPEPHAGTGFGGSNDE